MPAFHCPIGAAMPGDAICINCGLCHAETKEQYKTAREKIALYLRQSNAKRLERYRIQKMAVCGKGGVGKSTVTFLLASKLLQMGYRVIVVDMDSSNPFLCHRFEMEVPLPLVSIRNFEDTESREWMLQDTILVNEIPEKFIAVKDELYIMAAGKIENAFQGCACTIAGLMKDFLSKIQIGNKEILIIDNEAGIENFGRGVEMETDTILSIVEPGIDSLMLNKKIHELCVEMGIPRFWTILNRITDEEDQEIMIRRLVEDDIRYLGVLHADRKLGMESLRKQSYRPEAHESLEKETGHIIQIMLDECEMEYDSF